MDAVDVMRKRADVTERLRSWWDKVPEEERLKQSRDLAKSVSRSEETVRVWLGGREGTNRCVTSNAVDAVERFLRGK